VRGSILDEFFDKTLLVDYGFADPELSAKKNDGDYVGVRRILGPGVPVIRELLYKVKKAAPIAFERRFDVRGLGFIYNR